MAGFRIQAVLVASAALLEGCAAASAPLVASPVATQVVAPALKSDQNRSWMLPDAKAKDLLYVSLTNSVYVYSYPEGKRAGTLKGFLTAAGLCADPAGDVFVADYSAQKVYEYAHGATVAKKTLDDPRGSPNGCSVDPKTGNLAVTNYCTVISSSVCAGDGALAIYRHAQGKPTVYPYSGKLPFYCGYDDAKNVFLDAQDRLDRKKGVLAELPWGGHVLKQIALPEKIKGYGGVQWDGTYLAVGNGLNEVFRVRVSGSQGQVKGTVHLEKARYVHQFWIQNGTVIGPNGRVYDRSSVGFWNYPAGGEPIKLIDMLPSATGAAISPVQSFPRANR